MASSPAPPASQQQPRRPPRQPPTLPPQALPANPSVAYVQATILASLMAAAAGAAAAGAALTAKLVQILVAVGLVPVAAVALAALAGHGPQNVGRWAEMGPAGRHTRRQELAYRAAFLAAAAFRVRDRLVAGQSVSEALRPERRWWAAHLAALRRRAAAAAQVDEAARKHGDVLGWYLGNARTHTRECVAAAGHNFDVRYPPLIGYPGQVHSRCACTAGPAHPGAGTVDNATIGVI